MKALSEVEGGNSGNVSLRATLNWDEDFYWKVQGRLIEDGKIAPGRGRGGSVRIINLDTGPSANGSGEVPSEPTIDLTKERELYLPIKSSLENKWINKFGFDEVRVDETHSRGSKDTGGTYTRPDVTAAGIRRYVFLPKRLEILTFEIKTSEAVNVMGILEAIAHREAAHRSYTIYATSKGKFDVSMEAERITELAQKYGIGIILIENPESVDTWEILLEAIRHEPDPSRLDRFLGDLPNEEMKKQLSKWKE